jgi:membrane fusion protein (multidrug efflux system)
VPRLLIPLPALQRDSIGEYVYSVDAELRITRKAVQSGLRIDAQVEILDGLAAGDQVVSRGFVNLHEGMAVQTAAPAATPTVP